MTNWFAGIGQALSGVDAARYALSVVSQNIENADTDGYSEQSVQQAAAAGPMRSLYATPPPTGGLNGVSITGTARNDDPVLDARMRRQHAGAASSDATAAALSTIEAQFPEPASDGLSAQLSAYWSAWGTVATNPGDTTARSQLLTAAQQVVGMLHSLAGSLGDTASDLSDSLNGTLNAANTAAGQLAGLNSQIAVAAAGGENTNALLDQRDALLDTLSTSVGATATINANGTATVTVGGQSLVSGSTAATLSADAGTHQVALGGSDVTLGGGTAAGQVTALTTTLPGYQGELDAVADALTASGNAVQAAGYDAAGNAGQPMFGGSGAAGIQVVLTDPAGVAAAGTPGGNLDGSNALAASQQGSAAGGPDAKYTALVGDVASASALAQQDQTVQDALASNVDSLHASVSGVSYDEEVSKMLTYQNAFSASSRVMTTLDQMLDTLINHTGMVGLS